jgi:rhodanese-related sulfurtransferase
MPRTRHVHRAARRPRSRGPKYRTWTIAAFVLVLLVGAYFVLRPHGGLPSEIAAREAYDMYRSGATFLDVRTQAEWDQAHIPKSLSIPLDELESRLDELPPQSDIVVVCRSGVRSREGANILRQAGFTRVTCLSGGLQAWSSAGYPLEAWPDAGSTLPLAILHPRV